MSEELIRLDLKELGGLHDSGDHMEREDLELVVAGEVALVNALVSCGTREIKGRVMVIGYKRGDETQAWWGAGFGPPASLPKPLYFGGIGIYVTTKLHLVPLAIVTVAEAWMVTSDMPHADEIGTVDSLEDVPGRKEILIVQCSTRGEMLAVYSAMGRTPEGNIILLDKDVLYAEADGGDTSFSARMLEPFWKTVDA